jgi:PAS domain S-box-containing protein
MVAAIEGLHSANFRLPNPPAFLLPLVVVVAFWSGQRPGLLAAAVAVLYNLYHFSTPGRFGHYTRDDLVRVLVWAVTIPGTALLVGWLRDRLERAEHAALVASEQRFSKAFDASPLAMAVIGLDGDRVLQANQAFLTLLRLPSDALPTQTFSQMLVKGGDRSGPHDGQAWQEEMVLRTSAGSEVTTLASFEHIELRAQPCLLGFFYDITERRRLEENLRQAQKMEAMGRLAGGIAHDFNNLLTVINTDALLLQRSVRPAEERAELAKEILEAGERAVGLTGQLLAFSRKQPLRLQILSLNEVVTRAMPLVKRLLPAHVEVLTSLDPRLHSVLADRTQMDQVLLNLVTNARDAMPSGGRLCVTTANVQAAGAQRVRLSVSDTGVGIDPAAQPHVFEPFFTTRASGKGTGLGLATVYSVLRQTGGDVTVDSTLGRGSTFHVLLPSAGEGVAGAAPSEAAGPSTPGMGETILLAEDEPAVRVVVARTLRSSGYQVLEAGDGAEGVAVAQAHAGPIDLLLTDVVMPGMSGRQLAAQLVGMRPEMRVLYMSGHTNDPVLDAAASKLSVSLLSKPFTPERLEEAVREALQQTKPALLP